MKTRLAPVLFVALVILAGTATHAYAESPGSSPLLAQSVGFTDPGDVPANMTVIFVPPAPDGFADGGDGFADGGDAPAGFQWVVPVGLPDGFADGGDAPVPDGFVAALAQPAGDEFWNTGLVPDGLVPVLAWLPPDGFADGGDLPVGYVPILLPANSGDAGGSGG